MNEQPYPHRNLLILLLALIVVKTAFLVILGPVHTPDSRVYSEFAGHMFIDTGWLREVDLNKFWQPLTAFRIIGYPLLIATAKTITPMYWDWLLVLAQFSLSLVATAFVYRLAVRLIGNVKIALFAAAAHGLGQGFVMDQCILTDSLNGSLLVIMASYVGIAVLDKKTPDRKSVV